MTLDSHQNRTSQRLGLERCLIAVVCRGFLTGPYNVRGINEKTFLVIIFRTLMKLTLFTKQGNTIILAGCRRPKLYHVASSFTRTTLPRSLFSATCFWLARIVMGWGAWESPLLNRVCVSGKVPVDPSLRCVFLVGGQEKSVSQNPGRPGSTVPGLVFHKHFSGPRCAGNL